MSQLIPKISAQASQDAAVRTVNIALDSSSPAEQSVKKFIENDAGDGTRREDQYLTGAKLVLCVISIALCMFLVGLDQTIVATILNQVGTEFNAVGKVVWLMTGFFLPSTVFSANWGQISIIFGRKYTMVVCVVLFEAGSLMCALAPNMNTLIGGRVLAGVGASGIQSLAFIIASEVTAINKRPFVFACMGISMAVSLVCGPLIGGAFGSNVSWRWCFYINLPVGGVASVFFVYSFNPPNPVFDLRTKLKLVDYIGTTLIAIGLVLFLLGLSFYSTNEYPMKSAAVIVNIILGAFFFIGFCVWNFRFSPRPLIPVEMVTTPGVLFAGITSFFMMSYFTVCILFLSLYWELVLGYSPIKSGINSLPFVIPLVICSISTGVLIGKTRFIKPLLMLGSVFAVAGTAVLPLLNQDSDSSHRIGLVIMVGASFGLLLQSVMSSTQVSAPKIEGGVIMSTSFITFGRGLGSSLCTILSDIAYNSSLKSKYTSAMKTVPKSIATQIDQYSLTELANDSDIIAALSPDAARFVRKILEDAIYSAFYFAIALAACTMISGVFTTNRKIPKGDNVALANRDDEEQKAKVNNEDENTDVGEVTEAKEV
ncbi:hypothetical protein PSN45_002364 [Yamadazyma tenuis]|uniref:Major facilitator superfamily (MFS) profile domain-containing protein n=1 Tax=Candida tenuis (strain ATCC 10573 / BCRC 21748 / CBS 615 / JCM 9827 / NBRC 10315 / NRRL Y-1498 / VKM Y-70) TaxID=590646 RepID=G3B0R5_CANTC|nr:uncharacterized protein CANTEDRAFT_119917 [Yamadazyma tenuis ATCC 10573]EGV65457.1 hypothetical protein CANTEDRAFT_119917 [Yamadazyma tenuis ATCC 10573]WEJ94864.1 hypothetical protein PSN45_002364 [Yamadazyma tenuis]